MHQVAKTGDCRPSGFDPTATHTAFNRFWKAPALFLAERKTFLHIALMFCQRELFQPLAISAWQE